MPETPPFNRDPERDRCDELLVQEAIYGLDELGQSELDELVRHFQPSEDDRFDLAVAAIDIGMNGASANDSPPGDFSERLRNRIIADADAFVSPRGEPAMSQEPAPVSRPPTRWTTREMWFGMVTAASLLLAIASLTGLFNRPGPEPVAPSFAELREQLISGGGPNLRQVVWTATEDEAASNASGDIVWSDEKQEGYMRFQGLVANDPSVNQYQLWIFDTERDDELPVDGGVFDIGSDGEVIVPVDAKLAISKARMFAITIEKPGGVVKSERKRLPLLATVE